jgi:hypothetical protein
MLSNDGVTYFPFVVYGDPAYFMTACVQCAHKGANMTRARSALRDARAPPRARAAAKRRASGAS